MNGVDPKQLSLLTEPFPVDDIEWRIVESGVRQNGCWAKAVAYIQSRAIHRRLDDVCGMHNWQVRYSVQGDGAIAEIGILVRYSDTECHWIWKSGGAAPTHIEGYKGMLSGAEKRAGVPWGIGRYLYDLEETWVDASLEKQTAFGWRYGQMKIRGTSEKKSFWWKEPDLPEWAIPVSRYRMDLDTAVAEAKLYITTPEAWAEFQTKLRNDYRTNDIQYIFRQYGQKIISELKGETK